MSKPKQLKKKVKRKINLLNLHVPLQSDIDTFSKLLMRPTISPDFFESGCSFQDNLENVTLHQYKSHNQDLVLIPSRQKLCIWRTHASCCQWGRGCVFHIIHCTWLDFTKKCGGSDCVGEVWGRGFWLDFPPYFILSSLAGFFLLTYVSKGLHEDFDDM